MNTLSATEALVVGVEILIQLQILAETPRIASPSWVYQEIMERVDISDEYFQGVIIELSRLSNISIEGDIYRASLLEEGYEFNES